MVASLTAELFFCITLVFVGCFNLAGLCYAQNGLKFEAFLMGAFQLVVAVILFMYPYESLVYITIMIALMMIFHGFYHIAIAWKNRDLHR